MWALARIARGSTVFENSPPSSRSSASHDAPQNSPDSSPLMRLVPPGHRRRRTAAGVEPTDGS